MDTDLSKSLKRCLSVPIINNMPTNSSAPASTLTTPNQTPKKEPPSVEKMAVGTGTALTPCSSNPPSREVSPVPIFNIFSTRARRYSASFSPMAGTPGSVPPRLTPRVSQLRQEECADMNTREVNHEREVHSAMQISQSWEDLTLVAENWSCKSEDMTNPLHVTLPSGITSCSSPSPTSSRPAMRLPYGLSPSPTRRTFATRRSMSPIAMRPSQLGPVKRRFEVDEGGNWGNSYSSQPMKKLMTDSNCSRASSPSICQSPSSICPSPDSGTYEGRTTPKLFISKLCTTYTNSSSSMCSSPMAPSPGTDAGIDMQSNASSSPANTITVSQSSSEPMCVTLFDGLSNDSSTTTTTPKLDAGKSMEDSSSDKSTTDAESEDKSTSATDIFSSDGAKEQV